MKTFKPRTSAWLILMALCAPFSIVGAADLFLNPSGWPYGVALIALAVFAVGYNLTARLVIDEEVVTFKTLRPGRLARPQTQHSD